MARHDSRRTSLSGRHQPELPVRDRNWPTQGARRIAEEIRPRAGRTAGPSDRIRSEAHGTLFGSTIETLTRVLIVASAGLAIARGGIPPKSCLTPAAGA